MKRFIKLGSSILLVCIGLVAIELIHEQLLPIGANAPSPTGGSPSVGVANELDVADGAGGWLDTGCNVLGTEVNCPAATFATTRQVVSGAKSCPLFPDNYWINKDVSTYPPDPVWPNVYAAMFTNTGPAFTNATWASGTATITVASTAAIVNLGHYAIGHAVSANCLTGADCGFNSQNVALNDPSGAPTVTVVNGTTFTYPLTSNPGAWSSGGTIYTTNTRFKQNPAMSLNITDNTTPTLTSSHASAANRTSARVRSSRSLSSKNLATS